MTRLRYLWVQLRQSFAKRRKDATFRIAPAVDAIIASTALAFDAEILCIGSRNKIEPDCWRKRGFHRVTAVDLMPSAGVHFADMHHLPFTDHAFDVVFASHVLEHALDPWVAIREVVRVLRPGGYCYVAVPTGFVPNDHDRVDFGNLRGLLGYIPAYCHVRPLWSRHAQDELVTLLKIGRQLPAGQK